MSDEKKEIVSLNKEFMNLDFDDISVEELERRLELAVAVFLDVEQVECNSFCCTLDRDAGTCGTYSCATNS